MISFRQIIALISLLLLLTANMISMAQPPPPPPGGGHGTGGNSPPGAGAPIGEGMFFLIGLAGLYGGKKVYSLIKQLDVNA